MGTAFLHLQSHGIIPVCHVVRHVEQYKSQTTMACLDVKYKLTCRIYRGTRHLLTCFLLNNCKAWDHLPFFCSIPFNVRYWTKDTDTVKDRSECLIVQVALPLLLPNVCLLLIISLSCQMEFLPCFRVTKVQLQRMGRGSERTSGGTKIHTNIQKNSNKHKMQVIFEECVGIFEIILWNKNSNKARNILVWSRIRVVSIRVNILPLQYAWY